MEILFTVTPCGQSFSESGGMLVILNALSSSLVVEAHHLDKVYTLSFTEGRLKEPMQEEQKPATISNLTIIEFVPDAKIWNLNT